MKCPICKSYSTFKRLDMKEHIYDTHDKLEIIDKLIDCRILVEDTSLDED